MTEQEFFAVERDASLKEEYHGAKIIDIFSKKIKKECPGAKITDARIHYAFGCQLDLKWRSRKFEKRVCKTDPLVPAVPIEELKLWEVVGLNRSGNFEEALEDTCYSEECESCHGAGHLECPGCHGKGIEPCSECHGHEPHKCPTCGGAGSYRTSCYACGGTGRKRCVKCDGDGSVQCPACGGSGGRSSGYWTGNTYIKPSTCTHCHGLGVLTCPTCNGEGSKVCERCGGRGGESYRCEACHGTGELHHCERCHDKGVLRCHVCKGDKKLHCEKCGDVGHHNWIYYLIQRERTKTLRSVSVAECWRGQSRKRYKTIDAESDCDKMEFAVTGGDALNFGSDGVPESLRLRVERMWQAMLWDKEFEEYYDDVQLENEQQKDKSSEKKADKNGDWECRELEGKLVVTKIDTHVYVNIRWKDMKSRVFFEPVTGTVGFARGIRDKQAELRAKTEKRNGYINLWYPPVLIGLATYVLGVQCNFWKQAEISLLLSFAAEWYCVMSLWMAENLPGIYNFWNWPVVLAVFAIAICEPLFSATNRGIFARVISLLAMAAGACLMLVLLFGPGTSWYLAIVVDFVALIVFGKLGEDLRDDGRMEVWSLLSFLNTAILVWAIVYCAYLIVK